MIALLLAEQASAPASAFAPPLDRPYRIVVHQERTQAGATRRYEFERRLVFHRDGTALVADMTLVRVGHDLGGDSGRRYEAAAGALKGRTVRFRLAADGSVASIDDEEAVWATATASIAVAQARADRKATARPPIGPLAEVGAERRRGMLASPLTSLIARDDAARAPGNGAVAVAGRLVAGHSLTGTRKVTIDGDARLHVVLHAGDDDADSPITLDRERVVDPKTWLVVDEQETQSTGRGDTAQTLRQHVSVRPVL